VFQTQNILTSNFFGCHTLYAKIRNSEVIVEFKVHMYWICNYFPLWFHNIDNIKFTAVE